MGLPLEYKSWSARAEDIKFFALCVTKGLTNVFFARLVGEQLGDELLPRFQGLARSPVLDDLEAEIGFGSTLLVESVEMLDI